jgi:hypothetical protein
MASFNIRDSKIDQLSESGNNYQFTNESGNNTVSENGSVVQTEGRDNRIQVNKPAESLWSSLWAKAKALLGYFTAPKS